MIPRMIHDNPPDNATPCGTNATLSSPISPDGTPEIGRRYTIPARQGRAVRLAKGQSIRIVNTHGTQVCDTWAFNARTAPSICPGRTRAPGSTAPSRFRATRSSPIAAGRSSPSSRTPRPACTTR